MPGGLGGFGVDTEVLSDKRTEPDLLAGLQLAALRADKRDLGAVFGWVQRLGALLDKPEINPNWPRSTHPAAAPVRMNT